MKGLFIIRRVGIATEQELLCFEPAQRELFLEEILRFFDPGNSLLLVVEGFGVHLSERGQHPVAEGVDHEALHVERSPTEILGHAHWIDDRVQQRNGGNDRVAVRGLDGERLQRQVRRLYEQLSALIEVFVYFAGNNCSLCLRPRLLSIIARFEDLNSPWKGMHCYAGAEKIKTWPVDAILNPGIDPEALLLHSVLVRKHPSGTGAIQDGHDYRGEERQQKKASRRHLQPLQRRALADNFYHQ